MLAFTSVTKSYIPKARVLAQSLKAHNPDWKLHVVISDDLPSDFALEREPFDEVILIQDLPVDNWKSWAFGHSVVELCTAVKGPTARMLARKPSVDKIVYLDPDIKVFASLAPLEQMLDHSSVLLTPHLLDPETDEQGVLDNEICTLQHGVYNLGFFAARCDGQGLQFVDWWADRLQRHCIADIPRGLFTDQRWCDLAPCFFDRLQIVRDRGYNVATWNIAYRRLSQMNGGRFLAGDVPLRFYHFTGFDSGDGLGMLSRYASDQAAAQALWDQYARDLADAGHGDAKLQSWKLGHFDNGDAIPLELRRLYRSRIDLQEAFNDPFSVEGSCLWAWWRAKSEPQDRRHRPVEDANLPFAARPDRLRDRAFAAMRNWLPV